MNHIFRYLTALSIVIISGCYALFNQSPLIPRSVLFDNPQKASPTISPDGSRLAYLAPHNGVLNVWVKSVEKNDDYVLTNETDRPIQNYFWAPNSNEILYLKDKGGNENDQLYATDITSKQTRCLTPYENVKVKIVSILKQFPDTILLTINKNNPRLFDVYELTVSTGDLTMVAENPGTFTAWCADRNFIVRAGLSQNKDGSKALYMRNNAEEPWEIVRSWNFQDGKSVTIIGFDTTGTSFFMFESTDSDTSQLVKMDLKTHAIEVLASDNIYDINREIFFDNNTYLPQAVAVERERIEWIALDPTIDQDFKVIQSLDRGDFSIISYDNNQLIWIIEFFKDNGPVSYWLYDRAQQKGIFLFDARPDLHNYTLASMEPMQFIARDGLNIHGYITYPVHLKRKDLPLVLVVHGGPWARDSWGYSGNTQWLANRGYAVLQVNFRGSLGYGKQFLNAGNKEWGRKMHYDLLDAVDWAIKQGAINPKKIAIYGASYGGYAALVGATFTPDTFCCAVDLVGPSNIDTLIKSIPPYWTLLLTDFYKRICNPETEPQLCKECSPLFKVENIKIPMLIVQGANDPRVKQAESEQFVEAMKAKNIPHEYLLFSDEGHGLAKPENRITFYKTAERFLAQCMGGRCED